MNFESEYRRNTYYENIEKAKMLARISKKDAPGMSRSDQAYVERCEEHFGNKEEHIYAGALEALMTIRINQGAWFNDPADDSYTTEVIVTNKYDDYYHRADGGAIVHATEESPAQESADLAFCFDVTVSSDPDVISDKLLVSSNDQDSHLPVGFSEIKYLSEKCSMQGPINVPRYCIGISKQRVCDILEMSEKRPDNSILFGGSDATTRFKILYEMSIQNQLFEGALYHQEDHGTISEEDEKLLRQIEALDAIYVTELTKVAKCLPEFATRDTDFNPDAIAHRLQEGQFGDDGDETFRMICEQTEAIASAMFGSDDPDKTIRQLSDDARAAKRAARF